MVSTSSKRRLRPIVETNFWVKAVREPSLEADAIDAARTPRLQSAVDVVKARDDDNVSLATADAAQPLVLRDYNISLNRAAAAVHAVHTRFSSSRTTHQ